MTVGLSTAAIRPREDGSFCVDIIAGQATVRDPGEDAGCTGPEFTATVGETSLSCANEVTCSTITPTDFADFCFSS